MADARIQRTSERKADTGAGETALETRLHYEGKTAPRGPQLSGLRPP